MPISLERKIYWGFGLALFILVVVGVISYRSTAVLIEANRRVASTDQVITNVVGLLSHLNEAESAERGYTLTADPAHLAGYRTAASGTLQALDKLRELTAGNSEQQERLTRLAPLVQRRLGLLDASIGLQGARAGERPNPTSLIKEGSELMDQIRNALEEMEVQEGNLLRSRAIVLETDARRTRFIIALASSVAFLFVAASVLLIERDVTRRRLAERSLRQLSGRLLHLQDEERRRLARELHDSTAQSLVALSMNLNLIGESASVLRPTSLRALEESLALCDDCSAEIRTISYLLHPPLLDEMGLASALRWYGDGFTKRSRIRLDLEVSPALGRLPKDVETTVFRIIQESLTNIHRHSGSPSATIRLSRDSASVILEVEDKGKGMPAEILERSRAGVWLGVGLAGMHERVEQLGGHLEIDSDGHGTRIRATIPVAGGES